MGATQTEPTRELLRRCGVDPDQLASGIEQNVQRGRPREAPPSLTPAAKRTLLAAHQISSAFGSSYIGPEHLLLALAAHSESAAGQLLSESGITPESLQAAASGTHSQPTEAARQSATPTLDQYGHDLSEGFAPEFGARPMRRTIQREVDNELSRLMLQRQVTIGAKVTVGQQDGRLSFHVSGA